jgi:hypothetical protein
MTSSAEAWKFRFGADISASDGTAGKLVAVVADEQGQTLTSLGIRVRLFRRHHFFVPVEVITDADAERVTLNIALDETESSPRARLANGRATYRRLSTPRRGISAGECSDTRRL